MEARPRFDEKLTHFMLDTNLVVSDIFENISKYSGMNEKMFD